ncbi:MAG: anti-sigma factor [Gammaproteobacteria bacterium]
MHTDTRQLLALIDGEPVDAAARVHALSCADCQSELDRLQRTRSRLQALPEITPPPMTAQVLNATGARAGWARPVVAASLICVSVFAIVFAGLGVSKSPPAVAAVEQPRAAQGSVQEPVSPGLTTKSAALEREWRSLSARNGAVRRVGYELGTSRIKARLLQLDTQFAAGGTNHYWNQRVQLLDSLVEIERAELLAQGDRAYQVVRASPLQKI